MSEQFTIGQSLTYEQAMALPDGAVVSLGIGPRNRYKFMTPIDVSAATSTCGVKNLSVGKKHWIENGGFDWHSARLESLPEPANPELPVWVITCDRCGTTYKNNERHACAASKPSEPSPGEGYRWVEIGERLITGDQRESSRGAGDWFADNLPGVSCQDVHCYRRRIEPQAEPSKPERQASEIEKEAAIDSIELRIGRIIDFTHDNYVRGGDVKTLVELCRGLIAAHDYAKYIGALSE